MTGLVRKATLLGVCGLFCASAALAFVPDPGNSVVRVIPIVTKVGSPSVPYAPFYKVRVTVRDNTNTGIANCRVWVDVSACCDVNLCNVDGQTATRTADFITNGSGFVEFPVIGASRAVTTPPNVYAYNPAVLTACNGPDVINDPAGGEAYNGAHVWANSGTGDVDITANPGNGVTTPVLDNNGTLEPGGGSANSGDQSATQYETNYIQNNMGGARYLGRLDISCAFCIGATPPVGQEPCSNANCGDINSADHSFSIAATNQSGNSGPILCANASFFHRTCP